MRLTLALNKRDQSVLFCASLEGRYMYNVVWSTEDRQTMAGTVQWLWWCLCVVVIGSCGLVSGGTYTVTDEAWFYVEVRNLDGPGKHFRANFTVALFGETVPLTVRNFVELTRGFKRRKEFLQYRGSPFHRIVPDLLVQTGDLKLGDGTGGTSIFGDSFVDENFTLKHRSAGWVSMANRGRDSNASQFLIMLTRAVWLDGKHVVFGKVIRGFDTILTIAELETNLTTQRPLKITRILSCGLNQLEKKYDLPTDKLDSKTDL